MSGEFHAVVELRKSMSMEQENKSKMEESLESLFDMVASSTELTGENLSPLVQELKEISERYSKPEIIARGGMKTICKVFDNKTGRFIAMAKLHKEAPQELYEPFLREARLTALLDHPNIISIYDIGLDDDSAPFFTMELKIGQGLNELLQEYHHRASNLSPDELNRLLEIFLKICDGVACAHSQGVLHLDLKPENIQAGLYGEVIICDWGLGKVIGDPDYDGGEFDRMLLNPDLLNNMTLADEVRGTPGFMAPEQIDENKSVAIHTDIYSLGALLYSMLTGAPPIDLNGSLDEVLERTRKGEISSPQERFPQKNVQPGLSAVAMKALALNAKSRYQTVEELRQDVYNFMTGYSTSAENAGFLTESKLFFKRNRTICLVILFALTLIGGLTVFFVNGLKNSKEQAETNQQVAIMQKERAEQALQLYIQQKGYLSSFVEEHFQMLQEEVYNFTDTKIFNDPVQWLDKALSYLDRMVKSEPNDPWPYMQRGYVHFLKQDLNKANADWAHFNVQAENLHMGSKKFAHKSIPGKLLDTDTLIALYKEIGLSRPHYVQTVLMTLYDGAMRKSLTSHARVVKYVIQTQNPKCRSVIFEYDEASSSLRLSGRKLTTLSTWSRHFNLKKKPDNIQVPLLRTLKLKRLDISGSGVKDVNELTGLGIEELDIRNTPVRDLKNLNEYLPNLKKITVSKGQLKANDAVWPNAQIKLIVK